MCCELSWRNIIQSSVIKEYWNRLKMSSSAFGMCVKEQKRKKANDRTLVVFVAGSLPGLPSLIYVHVYAMLFPQTMNVSHIIVGCIEKKVRLSKYMNCTFCQSQAYFFISACIHCIYIGLHCSAWHYVSMYCIALYCIVVLYYTALHCTALQCIALHFFILFFLCGMVQYAMVWHGMVLHCIVLYLPYCISLHCIALHYTVLNCILLYCKTHVEVKEGGVRIMQYQIVNG